jgi:deoxyribodipyrimidine photolyase-related protein
MNASIHTLRPVFWDQLSHTLASLSDADKENDVLLLGEFMDDASYVKHHPKKLVLLFSAQRHFAKELERKGYRVCYKKLDDEDNKGSIFQQIHALCSDTHVDRICFTHPGEYRQWSAIDSLKSALPHTPIDILEDDRFLCPLEDFKQWAEPRKSLRMEFFYREMRKKHGIFMENNDIPVGGQWNYDAQNRASPDAHIAPPEPYKNPLDDITKNVIQCVSKHFSHHFGSIEPFHFAVTRTQAWEVFHHFIQKSLSDFGTYQDAMVENEPWMYHAHISFYLNCGLLNPLECIQCAEKAYYEGRAPLNAVEGFIRQILGWREYVRGLYWMYMPKYKESNYLHATRSLPSFYWDETKTAMNCLKQCVKQTRQHAYAHHIQRLMLLGNFVLLTGIHPDEVNAWYLRVYADAFEWVEMPNVTGMVLFADNGLMASKPYAASGAYINKMSNYCKNCHYNVKKKTGRDACPFNYLYWDFLIRHAHKLKKNPRLAMPYRTLEKMSEENIHAIEKSAQNFLTTLS